MISNQTLLIDISNLRANGGISNLRVNKNFNNSLRFANFNLISATFWRRVSKKRNCIIIFQVNHYVVFSAVFHLNIGFYR